MKAAKHPARMSPETIESLAGGFTTLAVWAGAVAAAAGIFALIYATKDSDRKKKALEQFQTESKEKTALLNERAEQLKKEALVLQKEVVDGKLELARLEKDIQDATLPQCRDDA